MIRDLFQRMALFLAISLAAAACGTRSSQAAEARRSVVVYTSQDQTYAEPILRSFQEQTGIRVDASYDSEAVKTVGLANRLLAERRRPRCDVFWSNEELRVRQLAARGLFRSSNSWAAVGYRSRRIVINTNLLAAAAAPRSLLELTNTVWKGKVALAYPLFGTTATHFLALRQWWGPARWEAWCRALAANQPFVVDGNSVAAKLVARGEAALGLTDSDDIAAEQREGAPLLAMPINPETLLIPNAVAVVDRAPHPEGAEVLWRFLQQGEITRRLREAKALEGSAAREVDVPTLSPDWNRLLTELEPATETLKSVFLR